MSAARIPPTIVQPIADGLVFVDAESDMGGITSHPGHVIVSTKAGEAVALDRAAALALRDWINRWLDSDDGGES